MYEKDANMETKANQKGSRADWFHPPHLLLSEKICQPQEVSTAQAHTLYPPHYTIIKTTSSGNIAFKLSHVYDCSHPRTFQ